MYLHVFKTIYDVIVLKYFKPFMNHIDTAPQQKVSSYIFQLCVSLCAPETLLLCKAVGLWKLSLSPPHPLCLTGTSNKMIELHFEGCIIVTGQPKANMWAVGELIKHGTVATVFRHKTGFRHNKCHHGVHPEMYHAHPETEVSATFKIYIFCIF